MACYTTTKDWATQNSYTFNEQELKTNWLVENPQAIKWERAPVAK